MTLTDDQRRRYDRHLVIPDLGEAGQAKLAAARVLVVGAGGLGSPALYYLAAAGVGTLGVLDGDVVELSNLQRQILHTTDDIGRPKVASAAEKLRALNPDVDVVEHHLHLDTGTVGAVLAGYDVVVNAVDNFAARYLLNDACVLLEKTLVEGAILRYGGLAMTIGGGQTACYRCVFPEVPHDEGVASPAQAGVFGPVPGVIGSLQAGEVIKVVTGVGVPLYDRLLEYDAHEQRFHEVRVMREPACPVCGTAPTITSLAEAGSFDAGRGEAAATPASAAPEGS
jgi:molybdopterin/thiamine biosynthesis adenylyltransferase